MLHQGYKPMNKPLKILLFLILFINTSIFSATLQPMSKNQLTRAVVDKTLVSIGTDNLNGKTISNTFSMYLSPNGTIFGYMQHKPPGLPQIDIGAYTITTLGVLNIRWNKWDHHKLLHACLFETANAYLAIGCQNNVFHTLFMKSNVKSGNQLPKHPSTKS